jgi:hypothetical protein
MAKFLASYSTNIALLDLSAEKVEAVVSSLRTDFPSTTFLFKKCDISSWDEQKVAFEQIYNEHGSIDVVFANAGVGELGKFVEDEVEPTKPNLRTVDINLIGTLYSERKDCQKTKPLSMAEGSLSTQIGNSLYAKEHVHEERFDNMHSFKCRPVSLPSWPNVRCLETRCHRSSSIISKTIRTPWNTNQWDLSELYQ